jgi:hypothetical protein
MCPVCKAKEAEPEPVEAIVEETEPIEDEEETDIFTSIISGEEDKPVSDEPLLQTVQCPECEFEFSAKSKTPGLMAVTCPSCGTKGEIEF